MQTRFSQILYDDYKEASIKHGLEMSDIGNRAVRKFRSSGIDVASLPDLEVATTNPITIRLHCNISPKDFKKILAWYLDLNKNAKAPTPIVIDQKEIEALSEEQRADALIDNRIKILRSIENY